MADFEGAGLRDDEIDAITHLNAMREFRFDPFSVRPREQCTVGALRAEAAGHDVSTHSFDKGRFEKTVGLAASALQERATA